MAVSSRGFVCDLPVHGFSHFPLTLPQKRSVACGLDTFVTSHPNHCYFIYLLTDSWCVGGLEMSQSSLPGLPQTVSPSISPAMEPTPRPLMCHKCQLTAFLTHFSVSKPWVKFWPVTLLLPEFAGVFVIILKF
jgi:hypothetical protein